MRFAVYGLLFFIAGILLVNFPSVLGVTTLGLPAFPGAAGFGSRTPGGRGGRIFLVENLQDYSPGQPPVPGSLRAALEASGPRIVVFRTGGVIKLKDQIIIREPFLTIAGQTAPGDGIVLRAAPLVVATHDVIIRNLRVRVGDDRDGTTTTTRDGINISGTKAGGKEVYNVIIDHSSVSWGLDENFSTWTDKVHDITLQWNISSESLTCSIHVDEGAGSPACHGMGMIIGDHSKNITLHHNLLAHNNDRNPLIQAGTISEFINNIVYNWGGGSYPIKFSDSNNVNLPAYGSVVNNYFKRGVNSTTTSRVGVLLNSNLPGTSKIYVSGNIFAQIDGTPLGTDIVLDNTALKAASRPVDSGVSVDQSAGLVERVAKSVGAILPARDSVDRAIVESFSAGTGTLIDCLVSCDPGDRKSRFAPWPEYRAGTPLSDADRDGMPDNWETARGLNPNSAADALVVAASGYTRIEEYINGLFGASLQVTPTPTILPAGPATPVRVCDGTIDVDGNGVENIIDFMWLVVHFNQKVGRGVREGDLNCDGQVTIVDYVTFINISYTKSLKSL